MSELHEQIAGELGETATAPIEQIRQIIEQLGPERAQTLLAETQAIEAKGGLIIERLNRRRTPGGVYLFLARQACSESVLAQIFNERRLPDGTFERLPKPKQPHYTFGGDWPGMTLQAYQHLCMAGFSIKFPRLDIIGAFWTVYGETALLNLADQARTQKSVARRPFAHLLLSWAYAQLPPEMASQIDPPYFPPSRTARPERPERPDRKKYSSPRWDRPAPPEPRPTYGVSDTGEPLRLAYVDEFVVPRDTRPRRSISSPPRSAPPPPKPETPAAPQEPEHPTLNIDDDDLRDIARSAGVRRELDSSQLVVLTTARRLLGLKRLGELANQSQFDLKAGGIVAQNGDRLTSPETVFIYSLYARLNRTQRQSLPAPQGWLK